MKKGRSDHLQVHGRKDNQSKVYTAKGPRDRRLRLSAYTAIQFYDVQDRLGYERPTKAVDWLINKAKRAIDKLNEQSSHWPPITAGTDSTSNSTELVSNQQPNPTQPTKPCVQQPGAADHPWYAAFPQPSTTDNPNPFFQSEPHFTNNNIKCFFPATTSSLNLFEYTNADSLNHVIHRESLQAQDDLGLSLHLVQPESNLTRFLMNTQTMSQGTLSDSWHQDHHNIYTHHHDHGPGDCESSGFLSRCGYPARIYGDNQSEAN